MILKISNHRSYGVSVKALLSKGGRFNREGTSFLYLGTDYKTCIAELRGEVNQVCSVAKFICLKDLVFVDLTMTNESEFLSQFKKLMLEPVHIGIRHKYLISQFLSDIINGLGFDGILYNSTVSNGKNLVCFRPMDFNYIEYSEKMYITQKVEYFVSEVTDIYKKYKQYNNLLDSYNGREEERKKELFKHIDCKIEYQSRMDINKYLLDAKEKSYEDQIMILNKMVEKYKSDNIFSYEVYTARGDFYRDNNMIINAINDYYFSKRWKKINK